MNGNHYHHDPIGNAEKPHVLIVGAGFGGLGTAWQLDQYYKNSNNTTNNNTNNNNETDSETDSSCPFRVTLLDAGDAFSIGGTWQFVWNNRLSFDDVHWPLEKVAFSSKLITLMLQTTVLEWDVPGNRVRVIRRNSQKKTPTRNRQPDQQWIEYDKIVMACGAAFDSDRIPGLANCTNICSYDHVLRMREELNSLLQQAKQQQQQTNKESAALIFVLTISSVPYKCPPAPFEVVFLVEEAAREAKVRDKVRIILTCPVEWPMPLSSREVFLEVLQQRRIEYWPLQVLQRIDADTKTIYFDEKTAKHKKVNASLIWSVHPIRAPDFVQHADIAKDRRGFLPVANKLTQAVKCSQNNHHLHQHHHHHPNNSGTTHTAGTTIYAIGDCCSVSFMDKAAFIMPRGSHRPILPKNGEFAFKMGMSVAQDIIMSHSDSPRQHEKQEELEMFFDRSGSCIAEIGGTQGLVVEPDFTESCQNDAVPPIMHVDYYNHGEAKKVEWVNTYLEKIFGVNVPKLSIKQPARVRGETEQDEVDFQEMWRKWQ